MSGDRMARLQASHDRITAHGPPRRWIFPLLFALLRSYLPARRTRP